MTCRTCMTTPMTCTEVADRSFNARGEVVLCKAYKPYYRRITVGLVHSIVISLLFLFYAVLIGIFIGHEMTWKTAAEQQLRDNNTILMEGIRDKQAFYLPGSKIKLHPRRDGQVNVAIRR